MVIYVKDINGIVRPVPGALTGDLGISGKDAGGNYRALLVDASGRPLVASHGWIDDAWQKSPLPFGVSGSVVRAWNNTALPAGTVNVDDAVVPAGELWVITNVTILYIGTPPTDIRVGIVAGGALSVIFRQTAPASNVTYDRQGTWVMQPGIFLRMVVAGATLNDDMYGSALGYRIDTDQ